MTNQDRKRAKRYRTARESIAAGVDARIVLACLEFQEALDASGFDVRPPQGRAETERAYLIARAMTDVSRARTAVLDGGDVEQAAKRIRRAAADVRALRRVVVVVGAPDAGMARPGLLN